MGGSACCPQVWPGLLCIYESASYNLLIKFVVASLPPCFKGFTPVSIPPVQNITRFLKLIFG